MNSERLSMLFLLCEMIIIVFFSIKIIKIKYMRWITMVVTFAGMMAMGFFLFVQSIQKYDLFYRFDKDAEANGRVYFALGALLGTLIVLLGMKLIDNFIRKKSLNN